MGLERYCNSLCTVRSFSVTKCSPQQWFCLAIWQEGKIKAGLQYAMALFSVYGIINNLIISETAMSITLVSEFPVFWWPVLEPRTCYNGRKRISEVLFAYSVTNTLILHMEVCERESIHSINFVETGAKLLYLLSWCTLMFLQLFHFLTPTEFIQYTWKMSDRSASDLIVWMFAIADFVIWAFVFTMPWRPVCSAHFLAHGSHCVASPLVGWRNAAGWL